MEKQSKDLKNIKVKRDFLRTTLKQTYVNYWNLKAKKDIFEYGTQQTLERLHEYGADSLETVERMGGPQNGSWKCVSGQ